MEHVSPYFFSDLTCIKILHVLSFIFALLARYACVALCRGVLSTQVFLPPRLTIFACKLRSLRIVMGLSRENHGLLGVSKSVLWLWLCMVCVEIVDGNLKMILGMIWTIILRFAIQDISVEGKLVAVP